MMLDLAQECWISGWGATYEKGKTLGRPGWDIDFHSGTSSFESQLGYSVAFGFGQFTCAMYLAFPIRLNKNHQISPT